MADPEHYEDDFTDESVLELADDSDRDSVYADSPSDGYFEPRNHPQETFVEQSSMQAQSDSKTWEAVDSDTSAARSLRASPLRSPVEGGEATPLFDAGPAPPDYAAATAGSAPAGGSRREESGGGRTEPSGRQSTGTHRAGTRASPRSYGSIESVRSHSGVPAPEDGPQWPPRGSPFHSQFPWEPQGSLSSGNFPLTTQQWPQSMGNTPERAQHGYQYDEARHEYQQQKRRRWHSRCCKPTSISSLLLGIALICLLVLVARFARDGRRSPAPIDGGNKDGHDTTGDSPLPNPNMPEQPGPAHPPTSACPVRFTTKAKSYDFANPANFTLVEEMESVPYMTGGISGNIWISAAPADQAAAIRVWASYAVSEESWNVEDIGYDYSPDTLKLRFPRGYKTKGFWHRKPCMNVAIHIYLKQHLALDTLALVTKNLNIVAGEPAPSSSAIPEYNATQETWSIDRAAFTTSPGSVSASTWSSRETVIATRSGSITGSYALADLLSLSTTSGRINVGISSVLAAEHAGKERPAVLRAKSSSGGIHVGFPAVEGGSKVPWRDYRVEIQTRSGAISGKYFFTSAVEIVSGSGSISAVLQPFLSPREEGGDTRSAMLVSRASSGSTDLTLLPYHLASSTTTGGGDRIPATSNLTSSHTTRSGSLGLTYPASWEGMIEGSTRSGSVGITGEGVEFLSRSREKVVARKGLGGSSRIGFESASGSVGIRFG
ncbi:hypothetical protein LTR62_007247 [Meristemomyces frigidus]|uniref:Uncharacterized protein n=1 Tax=Meristemomyces frigidus TaxID=1508187 RepID=A0AAN7YDN7_9PEZI|nr:hypothetical protein LTR62_007247 [Meristemomyces frigidus]